MNFFAATCRVVTLLLICLLWTGCLPDGSSGLDEQKDPHFLAGQDRVNKMDYRGAIDSFEKALEANPKSASAHFELALLYEQREPNPARSIYHFERFLDLRPNSDKADIVKQRIAGCKQELVKSVTIAPGSPSLQRELERLKGEIERLMVENNQLRQRADAAAQAQPRPVATGNPIQQPAVQTRAPTQAPVVQAPPPQPVVRATMPATAQPPAPTRAPTVAPPKTHVIKPGETPSAIARMYGTRLEKLRAANPSMDERKLRPGQTLVIPQ